MSVFGAFGLAIRSELALPELPGLPVDGAPDVDIRFGDAGPPDAGLRWIGGVFQAAGDNCLYNVADVARFRIRRGRELIVEPAQAAEAATVRLYLLGGALGAVLHQRGLAPLHASTVRMRDIAVSLAGASGSGKSSLAAALLGRGHRLLGDDLCAVAAGAHGRPTTWPGVQRLKLRPDAAARTAESGLEAAPDIALKRHLIVPAEERRDSLALGAVYVIQRATAPCDPQIQPLRDSAAMSAIISNIYRPNLGRAVDGGGAQLRMAARLADSARICRLRFFPDPARIGDVAAAVEADVLQHAG